MPGALVWIGMSISQSAPAVLTSDCGLGEKSVPGFTHGGVVEVVIVIIKGG